MAGFTESALVRKLHSDLNNTQDSIQTLSLWLIHHRRHCSVITQVWQRELIKADARRKLTFLYLANDVVQNSKKRGPEFTNEFAKVMPAAFKSFSGVRFDPKTLQAIGRLINIWKERNIFDAKVNDALTAIWRPPSSSSSSASASASTSNSNSNNDSRSGSHSGSSGKRKESADKVVTKIESPAVKKTRLTPTSGAGAGAAAADESEPSPCEPDGSPPPSSDQLVETMSKLENTASGDAAIRERIAGFPPEVSDPVYLNKIRDKDQARRLKTTIEDALKILTDYNSKLDEEMEQRRQLRQMLVNYLHSLKQSQARLDEVMAANLALLDRAEKLEAEMQAHFDSLPDLARGEARMDVRLPDASDLFR